MRSMAELRNLFDGAFDARRVLPAGHDHLSAAVVHVEVVHEQTERFHVSQIRQAVQTQSCRIIDRRFSTIN